MLAVCFLDRMGKILKADGNIAGFFPIPPQTDVTSISAFEQYLGSEIVSEILYALKEMRTVEIKDVKINREWESQHSRLVVEIDLIPSNNEEYAILIFRDMTKYLIALEDIEKEKKFSQMILDKGGAMVVVLDIDGRIVKFNPVCEEVTGYKEEEVLGKKIWEFLLIEEEKGPVYSVFEKLVSNSAPNQFENYWITKSGELKRIAWTNTVERNEKGQIVYVIGTGFDITERFRRENNYKMQAMTDSLTGLPNRWYLKREMNRIIAKCKRDETYRFGLFFIDIDGFKHVNDQFGHVTGDEVLKEASNRLKKNLRENDFLARFGGDEFVALIEKIESPYSCISVGERLVCAVENPIYVKVHHVKISASIGVAIGDYKISEPNKLIDIADKAMYEAKHSGKRIVLANQ